MQCMVSCFCRTSSLCIGFYTQKLFSVLVVPLQNWLAAPTLHPTAPSNTEVRIQAHSGGDYFGTYPKTTVAVNLPQNCVPVMILIQCNADTIVI
jgi:hypothetical protein